MSFAPDEQKVCLYCCVLDFEALKSYCNVDDGAACIFVE